MTKHKWVLPVLLMTQLMFVSCSNPAADSEPKAVHHEETAQKQQDASKDKGKDSAPKGDSSTTEASKEEKQAKGEAQGKKKQDPANEAPQDPKLSFTYPDAVRGIYVTGHSAGGEKLTKLIELIKSTELNTMVIDIKDDYGNITYKPDSDSPLAPYGKNYIKDPKKLIKTLHKNDIYPIARIVVFKDTVLAEEKQELSFKRGSKLWKNGGGDAFVNPFVKEVWDHNVAIAKEAAALGFQEIQFDYVRFPEGFEKLGDSLSYEMGDYKNESDSVQARVKAVTDFVAYANEQLQPYDVDVSVDIFGYTVTLPEAPGIGQNISQISEHVDVISSMIYPSHWGPGNLDISKPDLAPYELVEKYAVKEKEKLYRLDNPPVSRPWIQDFTASWLGPGNYKKYGKQEVEAQIKALNEAGIHEFLVWNASNSYSSGVNYKPSISKEKVNQNKKQDEALKQAIKKEGDKHTDTEHANASDKSGKKTPTKAN